MFQVVTTYKSFLKTLTRCAGSLLLVSFFLHCSTLPVIANQVQTTVLEANTKTVLDNLVELPDTNDPLSNITNVSQLVDVSPGSWVDEALRSLVKHYGCIAKYPDGFYPGHRSMSRYEFAAALNTCSKHIEQLIAKNSADFVKQQDLEILQRLTNEFHPELITLAKQVETLQGKVDALTQHQFSTTTKLNGLAWLNLTGAMAGGKVKVETTNPNGINGDLALKPAGRENGKPAVRIVSRNPGITFSDFVWLTFNTSFTGKDNLVTQLAVGNGNSPANVFTSAGLYDTYGSPFLDETAGVQTGVNQIVIRELAYEFSVKSNIHLVVGPRINWHRFFDANIFTSLITGASSFNSDEIPILRTINRGAGAVFLWDISKHLHLHIGYLSESDEYLPNNLFNSASNPKQGLFNGTNVLTGELTFSPTQNTNFRFIYQRSNIQQINGQIGGPIGEPIYGYADDGFGGFLRNATADIFGFNFDWRVTPRFGLFGRYAYGSTHLTPADSTRPKSDVNAQSLQLGLAFPDLGKEGALATLSYVRPFSVLDGRKFLVSGGGDGGVQQEFEATYFYPLSDNVALVPAFYLIFQPNNFRENPNIYVGNLRLQFSF
jgi:hypothetical protein